MNLKKIAITFSAILSLNGCNSYNQASLKNSCEKIGEGLQAALQDTCKDDDCVYHDVVFYDETNICRISYGTEIRIQRIGFTEKDMNKCIGQEEICIAAGMVLLDRRYDLDIGMHEPDGSVLP